MISCVNNTVLISFPQHCKLTSSDKWALLAQNDDLGAHRLPCLLDGQTSFFIHVDDGDSGVHASSSHHRCNDGPCYHCRRHKKVGFTRHTTQPNKCCIYSVCTEINKDNSFSWTKTNSCHFRKIHTTVPHPCNPHSHLGRSKKQFVSEAKEHSTPAPDNT